MVGIGGDCVPAEFSDQAKSSSSDSGTAEDFSSSSVSESGQEEGSEGGSQRCRFRCMSAVPWLSGVYTLPEGSRVYEVVAMAGGLLETAEPRALNQARLLSDGEQITVLTVEEVQSGEIPVQENPAEILVKAEHCPSPQEKRSISIRRTRRN